MRVGGRSVERERDDRTNTGTTQRTTEELGWKELGASSSSRSIIRWNRSVLNGRKAISGWYGS